MVTREPVTDGVAVLPLRKDCLGPVPIVLVILSLLVSACSIANSPGKTRTETRTVSGFSAVDLQGSGQLTIEQTGVESLTIQAEDSVLPDLTSDVTDGTLRLGQKAGTNIVTSTPILYRLTIRDPAGLA